MNLPAFKPQHAKAKNSILIHAHALNCEILPLTLQFSLHLTAKDPDEGVSGTVSYTIVGSVIPKSLSLFKIHSSTGRIKTIKALDYKDMKEHTLIIKATDQGVPKRESLFSVVISVVDVNDHKPVFLRSEFQAEVDIDATPGTSILKVFASDDDDGTNAVLKFSIKGGNTNDEFYIDQNSGIIQVATKLSHSVDKYTLQIQVSDSGSPTQTAETEVEVSLNSFSLHVAIYSELGLKQTWLGSVAPTVCLRAVSILKKSTVKSPQNSRDNLQIARCLF